MEKYLSSEWLHGLQEKEEKPQQKRPYFQCPEKARPQAIAPGAPHARQVPPAEVRASACAASGVTLPARSSASEQPAGRQSQPGEGCCAVHQPEAGRQLARRPCCQALGSATGGGGRSGGGEPGQPNSDHAVAHDIEEVFVRSPPEPPCAEQRLKAVYALRALDRSADPCVGAPHTALHVAAQLGCQSF